MSNDLQQRPQPSPDQQFGKRITHIARQQCERLMGTTAGKQSAQRITMSILGAMQSARNPTAFHQCTDLSLANCIALSAQTGLMPGGPAPSVYLVPQAPRRGEQPQLHWRITHRGLSILAYRGGFAIRAVPVDNDDFLTISLGEVVEHSANVDAWPATLDDVRGIAVVVKDIERNRDVIRAWVPRAVIMKRRDKSRDLGIWNAWPVEMAQKTAIKYVFARGAIPLDSPELSAAMAAEVPADAEPHQAAPEIEPAGRGMDVLKSSLRRLESAPEPVPVEPVRERRPVPREQPPELVEPEPEPIANGAPSTSDLKLACHRLEGELTGEPDLKTRLNLPVIIDTRESCGIRQRADIRSTRYSADAMVAYRDALEQAVADAGGEE